MLKKVLIFTILTSMLSACVTGPDGYLKRSANNKLFDRKGFEGSKRPPVYNKKYIAQAKKNILNDNYDEPEMAEEDFHESEDISRENIEMYKAMIEADLARSKKRHTKKPKSRYNTDNAYPSIINAHNKINSDPHSDNLELREEIKQIKSMLNEAKTDLASYKCPTAEEIERQKNAPEYRPKETINRKELPESPLNNSTIIEPVKSI